MRYWFISALLLLFLSCQNNNGDDKEVSGQDDRIQFLFPQFPEYQFMGLKLGMGLDEVINILNKKGFEQNEHAENQYINKKEGLDVILTGGDNFLGFKVFMMADQDYKGKSEYLDFFSSLATEKSTSEEFSVFYFQNSDQDFKLTVFDQADVNTIRLNFELKSKH